MDLYIDATEFLNLDSVTLTEYASATFFILTAVLLALTYGLARGDLSEISAWCALATVTLAVHFMIVGWHKVSVPEKLDMPGYVARSTAATGGEFNDCTHCPTMVAIQAGVFIMGATDSEAGQDEGPLRTMMIPRIFAISRDVISAAQFTAFTAATDYRSKACPIRLDGEGPACASIVDAEAYVVWLKHQSGRHYRLLSSAEWEYAARAGAPTPSASPNPGLMRAAFTEFEAGRPAAGSAPNGFGLVSLGARAGELVADCWSPTLSDLPSNSVALTAPFGTRCGARVLKIVDTTLNGVGVRYSRRRAIAVDVAMPGIGFRVAREVPQAPRR